MYRTEVVGFLKSNRLCKSKEKPLRDMYVSSSLEKLNIHTCKYVRVLEVCMKTSNIASYGALNWYLLYVDTVFAIIKYCLHISKNSETDFLVTNALQDNNAMFQNKNDC